MHTENNYLVELLKIEVPLRNYILQHPELSDYSVLRVYENLVEIYKTEVKPERKLRLQRLEAHEQEIFDLLQPVCEELLGRRKAPKKQVSTVPIGLSELLECLKRLIKSVNTWIKRHGRQGYVRFICQALDEGADSILKAPDDAS
ncbi:MAG: hypothetical protein PHG44_05145 [Lentisphaeria bacterium]|jgi:hypothetical protein|nr:hypothetical protein [Lentisphaeria bacterium]MDY0175735.1 hypothetical protein [Lentisphaeria bacterium]NLZ59677.1 hypothetical protein [Lentisphaerota bacterium]